MPTATKDEKFSAPMVWADECVLPLAAAGVYPKTRVWGSDEQMLHSLSATVQLRIELRRGCENSSGKTTAGSALDSNGNTLTKTVGSNTTSYTWDFENRLTSVTLPGSGGTVTFKYDPLGRRIEKVSPTFTSIFVYDGDNLIETTNSSGGVVSRYTQTRNIDEPLAELRSTTTSYYEADGLGSITSLTNAAGAVANTYTYDSYGNLTASSGSVQNPFSYTGREFDSETGLYYYRARYYDPSAGRFVGEDPIEFNGGFNFYKYTVNSPINFVDPSGDQIGFKGDTLSTQTALLYLKSSPAANAIIQDLEKSPTLYIIDASNGHAYDVADPNGSFGPQHTAYWRPNRALCVQNGIQSPAIQLLHELTHLWQTQNNKPYDEENAVQITNPAAQQLGEPTRKNYDDKNGNPIWALPIPNR
jgi:RHS repeat-associated protein